MSWGQGSTRAWRKTRAEVLDRDDHRCRLRIPGICTTDATEVHHINGLAGRARRDATDPNECVAACPPCHQVITDQQRNDGRKTTRRPRRTHPADALSRPASAPLGDPPFGPAADPEWHSVRRSVHCNQNSR